MFDSVQLDSFYICKYLIKLAHISWSQVNAVQTASNKLSQLLIQSFNLFLLVEVSQQKITSTNKILPLFLFLRCLQLSSLSWQREL